MGLMCSIEEKYLLGFFSDYEAYRSRTHVFIPFIPMVHLQLASFSVFFKTTQISPFSGIQSSRFFSRRNHNWIQNIHVSSSCSWDT